MKFEDKLKKFTSDRDFFREKTSYDDLPIILTYGSSSHNPEESVNMQLSDTVLWCKFLDKWFIPYGRFNKFQIVEMINICSNDNQIIYLMEMLSCKLE